MSESLEEKEMLWELKAKGVFFFYSFFMFFQTFSRVLKTQ